MNAAPQFKVGTGGGGRIPGFSHLVMCREALSDSKWKKAMHKEMGALQKNDTWELMPLPNRKKKLSVDGCSP